MVSGTNWFDLRNGPEKLYRFDKIQKYRLGHLFRLLELLLRSKSHHIIARLSFSQIKSCVALVVRPASVTSPLISTI